MPLYSFEFHKAHPGKLQEDTRFFISVFKFWDCIHLSYCNISRISYCSWPTPLSLNITLL